MNNGLVGRVGPLEVRGADPEETEWQFVRSWRHLRTVTRRQST